MLDSQCECLNYFNILQKQIQRNMQSIPTNELKIEKIRTVICVAGNDGTGKSTICKFINEQVRKTRQDIYCIERSHKNCPIQFQIVLNQLKKLDQITYNYSFEPQRNQFQRSREIELKLNDKNNKAQTIKINIFWFILDLEPQVIRKRLHSRTIVDIYDSKKAVQYYSFIYRQFAWFYGMPIVSADQPTNQIVQKLVKWSSPTIYNNFTSLKFQSISIDFINERNMQNAFYQFLKNSDQHYSKIQKLVEKDILSNELKQFYCSNQQFNDLLYGKQNKIKQQVQKFYLLICSRWLIKKCIVSVDQQSTFLITYWNTQNEKKQQFKLPKFSSSLPFLKIYEQGESKILLSIHSSDPQIELYYKQKVIILLKSTIYSHTKQHTGEIANLGKIRALGNVLFLQMIRRNNLKHAYLSINHENGIILSQLVKTNQLEIVFKKQCLGTDKHSYHNMTAIQQIVEQNNCYSGGVYIRFDWRNPNHFLTSNPNVVINQDPYYYVVEKYFGKQNFFRIFLTTEIVKPMGDKCISEDSISRYAPLSKIKKNALKLYTTFLYYSRKVGLQILDGCFMFDSTGEIGWSEINPDCMRVKTIKDHVDYDKDIWRYGGSSKKQQIFQKWTQFNQLFIEWFKENRYHKTDMLQMPELCYPYQEICRSILSQNSKISNQYEYYYNQLISSRWDKRLIGTIDISQGKPILVKSSEITQQHSNESLEKAYNYISLLQELVLVDIDAAIGKQSNRNSNNSNNNNRLQIKQLLQKDRNKILGIGGGIRTRQSLDYYLNTIKSKRIILSSNLDLLKLMSKQDISNKIIVQLSINQFNQVLIKGRTINTHIHIVKKIYQLIELGVKTISITFNHCQGHLNGIPKKQFIQIYCQIPQCIQSIIVAGGISTVQDLNFIWGFKRCIPQLGSAIWKQKISIFQIYSNLIKFNEQGLVASIIFDQYNNPLGQVYLNKQALKLTCQTRKLHRYSRQHQKVMKKGQTSSNVYDVLNFKLDCDNDTLIISVKAEKNTNQQFCHKNQYSCFNQTLRKNDFRTLQSHILSKKQNGSGYSKKMMQNQGLAGMKIIEQIQELQISEDNKIHETADLIAHLIMYMNAHQISVGQVFRDLQNRSIDTIKIQSQNNQALALESENKYSQIENMVGVIFGKHSERIDKLTEEMVGIKLIRAKNRSVKIDYEITNNDLYTKFFGTQKISIVCIKAKDMATIISKQLAKKCLNYSVMMENYPIISRQIVKLPTPGIFLGLLGRKQQEIDPKSWSSKRKGIIVCQYPYSVNRYFKKQGISQDNYTLIRVSGGTEGYLASQNCKVDLCDAIVQTGKTIQENNLKVVAVLQQTIYTGYYESL